MIDFPKDPMPCFDPIEPPDPFWVFAYGSLMWNPEFAYLKCGKATLTGYHRALCIYSIHYRGTREEPGLVLGLDEGGQCEGRAFLVAPENRQPVMQYLTTREMRHGSYCQSILGITLDNGEKVDALCYVANRDHWQYVTDQSIEDMAARVQQGQGAGGANIDYLSNTVAHLIDLGIHEPVLKAVLQQANQCKKTGTSP